MSRGWDWLTDLQKDPGHAKGTIYNTLRLELSRGLVRLVNPIVLSAKLFPTLRPCSFLKAEPHGGNISGVSVAV